MPELIDKKETIAKAFALSGFFIDRSDYEFELISAIIQRCCEEIDKQPTIEAEPMRHGYWIECDYKELRHGEIWTEHRAGLCCSVCRTGFKKSKMTYKQYCSACGARMDAEPPESEVN